MMEVLTLLIWTLAVTVLNRVIAIHFYFSV